MKNASRKIITSVLTLVLTIVALGTTTFAWFSLSTVSNVSNIEGTITAGDGVEVRLASYLTGDVAGAPTYSTKWKSNLSSDDVSEFIELIFADKKFAPVTKSNWTTEGNGFKKSGTTDKGNIWIGDDAVANEDFLEFTIEFRSQKTGEVVLTKLDIDGPVAVTDFVVEGDPYLQVKEETTPTALPVETSAAYGARVSFSVGSTNSVFQYGEESIEFDDETTPTKVQGNTVMGNVGIDAGQWSYITTSQGLEFHNAKEEVTGTTKITSSAASILAAKGNEEDLDDVTISLTDLTEENGKFIGSVVVRIWIEGWDADSYDSIYGLKLIVSMIFEKDPEVVQP